MLTYIDVYIVCAMLLHIYLFEHLVNRKSIPIRAQTLTCPVGYLLEVPALEQIWRPQICCQWVFPRT